MLLPLLEAGTLDSVDGLMSGAVRQEDLPNLPSPSLLIFLITFPSFHRCGLTLFPTAPLEVAGPSHLANFKESFLGSHSGLFP